MFRSFWRDNVPAKSLQEVSQLSIPAAKKPPVRTPIPFRILISLRFYGVKKSLIDCRKFFPNFAFFETMKIYHHQIPIDRSQISTVTVVFDYV